MDFVATGKSLPVLDKMCKSIYSAVSILIYALSNVWGVVFKWKCVSCFSWPGSVSIYFPAALCDGFVFQYEVAPKILKVAVVAFLWDGCKLRATYLKIKTLQKPTIVSSPTSPVVKFNINS